MQHIPVRKFITTSASFVKQTKVPNETQQQGTFLYLLLAIFMNEILTEVNMLSCFYYTKMKVIITALHEVTLRRF